MGYTDITQEKLSRPTTKDFSRMVSFLMKKSDKRYEDVKKLDEDLIAFLKKSKVPT